MKKQTQIIAIVLAVVMVLSMAACTKAPDSTPVDSGAEVAGEAAGSAGEAVAPETAAAPKNLVFAVNRDINDLSPLGARTAARTQFIHLLYNYLFCVPTLDSSIDAYQPEIAKSYSQPDAETVLVELYDYVQDSQGNPIKAEDVAFCYTLCAEGPGGAFLAPIMKSASAVGDYTVEFKVNPLGLGDLETILTYAPIFSKTWYESASNEDLTANPATTGSYTVGEMVTSSHVTLVKNANYWQNDAALRTRDNQQPFDTIKFTVVLESAMEVIALENGECDVARQIPVTELETFAGDEWECFGSKNPMFYCLLFNNSNSVFAGNQTLRQAVLYGVDQESLRLAFGNTKDSGGICKTMGVDIYPDYNSEWLNSDYYGYDFEKAKGMLAEAGHEGGGFKVRVLYVQNTASTAMITILQQELTELGIEVELLAYDQAMFDTLKFDDSAWDICIDQKGSNGFIATMWKTLFDPAAYENGSVCFTHDDTLTAMVAKASALDTHSQETVDELNAYLTDQAYCYGLFWNYAFFVGQATLGMNQDGMGEMCPGGWTPSADYASLCD